MARGATVQVKCARCGDPFTARVADRKRGWGKFCSRSCKAIKQTQKQGGRTYFADGGYVTADGREFDRNGILLGFQMSAADLAMGGYGDSDPYDGAPVGDGKW